MEEEKEESVQHLLNGVQLIGRWSIRYEKFPRGVLEEEEEGEEEVPDDFGSFVLERHRTYRSWLTTLSRLHTANMAANYRKLSVWISGEGADHFRSFPRDYRVAVHKINRVESV